MGMLCIHGKNYYKNMIFLLLVKTKKRKIELNEIIYSLDVSMEKIIFILVSKSDIDII